MICSFFGHRSVPDSIGKILKQEICSIVEFFNYDVTFYVGNKGQYDRLVQYILTELKQEHENIEVYVVLDYMLIKKDNYFHLPTILPEGIENVPKQFSMSYRNKWMINQCDMAVVYLKDVASNTRKHVDILKRKRKPYINIADMLFENLDNPDFLC